MSTVRVQVPGWLVVTIMFDLSPGAVIALASVVTSGLLVEAGWTLPPSILGGLLVGVVSGLLISVLVIAVQLPPFIATLGAMGIVRGAGFIITEGRYFDVSRLLPPGWRPLGIPLDWSTMVKTDVFNSNKCFAVFKQTTQTGPGTR